MYLLKHSQPDLSNAVCELSKLMDGVNMAQYKEMLHVLKFMLEMKSYELKFLPLNDEIWKLEEISDVNFASDKEIHISM